MGQLFSKAFTGHQIGEYKAYRDYKKAPEPGEGKIGITAMTEKQIADKKARDAAKTPVNQQKYS